MDACLSSIVWWICGFGFAFGNSAKNDPTNNGFIGQDYFLGMNVEENHQCHLWFFSYAFACIAATIVSGSLAERANVRAYLCFSLLITGWIYPVIAHWYWGKGWLYQLGYHDAAGSGIVHLTGGLCGLTAAIQCGPRLGRFKSIRPGGDTNKTNEQK